MNWKAIYLILGVAVMPSISFAVSDARSLCWIIVGGEGSPISECSELTSAEDRKLCDVIVWGQPTDNCSTLSVEEDKNFCGVIMGGPDAPAYGCEGLNNQERKLCDVIVWGKGECNDL